MHHPVASVRIDLHPANRVPMIGLAAIGTGIVAMPVSSMHHVGAASESHHQQEQSGKHQETQKTVHQTAPHLTGLTPAAGRSASDSGTATDKTTIGGDNRGNLDAGAT